MSAEVWTRQVAWMRAHGVRRARWAQTLRPALPELYRGDGESELDLLECELGAEPVALSPLTEEQEIEAKRERDRARMAAMDELTYGAG